MQTSSEDSIRKLRSRKIKKPAKSSKEIKSSSNLANNKKKISKNIIISSHENLPPPPQIYQEEEKELSIEDNLEEYQNENGSAEKQKKTYKRRYSSRMVDTTQPLLSADSFCHVQEIDFNIYSCYLARSKIYSVVLVDQFGRIIFADKLANQHLEGSLTNLNTNRIQDLVINPMRQNFINSLKSIDKFDSKTVIKFLIYSKNAKRRYALLPFNLREVTNKELYFYYLKSLSARIRPIQITFEEYQKFQGFWNSSLVCNNVGFKCFMLEVRFSKNIDLPPKEVLLADIKIVRFMQANKKKQEKNHTKIKMKPLKLNFFNPKPDYIQNQVKIEQAASSERSLNLQNLNYQQQQQQQQQQSEMKQEEEQIPKRKIFSMVLPKEEDNFIEELIRQYK